MTRGSAGLRAGVTVALGAGFAIFAYAAAHGITRSWPASAAAAVLAFLGVASWVRRWPEAELTAAPHSRWLRAGAAAGALLAVLLVARASVFMLDSTKPAYSLLPGSDWEVRHSCTSAYFVAAEAASRGADVYDDRLYTAADDDPTKIRKALRIGAFNVDPFEYPPQFLLVPRALRLVAPGFEEFRAAWFGLNGAWLLFASVVIARRVGPRALLLLPLMWLLLPAVNVLQKGNVQLSVIAASMLAMLLFERERNAAGGALLALSTVGKIYPGVLVIYLIARRQWRAVGWTIGFGAALSLVTLVVSGPSAYVDFLHHLPGLLSGEAFPAFRNPMAIANNISIPGLVFKLKIFGVPGMGFPAAKLVGWAYMLAGTALVVLAGRRSFAHERYPTVWMAILIVATLRSPFLPTAYGVIPPLWQLTMVAALCVPSVRTAVLTLLAWAALNLYWPVDWPLNPRVLAIVNFAPQTVAIALAVVPLWPRRRR